VTTRQLVIGVVLAFTVLFAYLTVDAMVRHGGPTVLTLVSLVVLALFGIALAGMLSQPPDE
jgi:hypothetical protein